MAKAKKASQKDEELRRVQRSDGSYQVLVELEAPRARGAATALEMSAALGDTGFQVDASFEPVPVKPTAETATALERDFKDVVVVRGFASEEEKAELEKQDNVVGVFYDFEVEPFTSTTSGEGGAFSDVGAAVGDCAIPPCDCDAGSPAKCSKGSLSDVAKYLGVDEIWAQGIKGKGIAIGIVDGGITAQGRPINAADASSPNWPNKLIPRVTAGWPTNNWGTTGVAWGWHGNMTATDALGMAPEAEIYDLRLTAPSLQATISNAIAAYNWAINRHKEDGTPHILSNSWGIYRKAWDPDYAENPNHPFTRKVVEAMDEGILVLFAAGNCGEACPSDRCGSDTGPDKSIWGANGHPGVMTVGAANIKGELIGYSSQGKAALDPGKPDFCSISHFTGFFNCDTGTSAACPIAAGVVALLKQAKSDLTQAKAKDCLKRTARNIGPAGWDIHSGSGIIHAKRALDCLGVVVSRCRRYRDAARRYLAAYRRTRNRRYLCGYYYYVAMYYRCRYSETRNRRYLCAYYLYLTYHYRCMYGLTGNSRYATLARRAYAAYRRCQRSL